MREEGRRQKTKLAKIGFYYGCFIYTFYIGSNECYVLPGQMRDTHTPAQTLTLKERGGCPSKSQCTLEFRVCFFLGSELIRYHVEFQM